MLQYTYRAAYPNGAEALCVKTKSGKMLTLFAEITANGRLISTVSQEISGTHYNYEMPEVGIHAEGVFSNMSFQVTRNGALVAAIEREDTLVQDSYVITLYDQSLELPIIGLAMFIEIDTIHRRTKRRRKNLRR